MNPEETGNTSLQGRWLFIARTTWVMVTIVAITMFIAGIPPFLDELRDLSPETKKVLESSGFSVDFFIRYIIAHQTAFAFAFVAIAAVIFWRKSNDWLAIFASLMLITYGINEPEIGGVLVRHYPTWRWPVESLQAFGIASVLIICYLFPSGRFVPRWTGWLTIVWVGLILIWLFFPDVPFNYIYGETAEQTPLGSFLVILFWIGTGVYAKIYRY